MSSKREWDDDDRAPLRALTCEGDGGKRSTGRSPPKPLGRDFFMAISSAAPPDASDVEWIDYEFEPSRKRQCPAASKPPSEFADSQQDSELIMADVEGAGGKHSESQPQQNESDLIMPRKAHGHAYM